MLGCMCGYLCVVSIYQENSQTVYVRQRVFCAGSLRKLKGHRLREMGSDKKLLSSLFLCCSARSHF